MINKSDNVTKLKKWNAGNVPITVVLITLNEAHNINNLLNNIEYWAKDVVVVDSYSTDGTVDILLSRSIKIVQRKFDGFGSQWNFAINFSTIKTPWVMKLDPDEELTEELKNSINLAINKNECDGIEFDRQLCFMRRPLQVNQKIVRAWKHGLCHFEPVLVNEHPIISGKILYIKGKLLHHDSPTLDHWYNKQNSYSTLEAEIKFKKLALATKPKIFGNTLERRILLKTLFYKIPLRYILLFIYNYIFLKSYKAGYVGYVWARLRSDVMRMTEYKYYEMKIINKIYKHSNFNNNEILVKVDPRVEQYK
jgi:glycosyltransferase involved in cell wall biosynthesis